MRVPSTMLMAAVLAAALSFGGVAAASNAHTAARHPSRTFSPMVIEWFSVMHPRAGQSDAVYARMLNGNKPVAGARLTADLMLGSRVVLTVKASTTDRNGQAKASFKVPGSVAGKSVRVAAVLTYKGNKYGGMNTLKVAG